MRKRNIKLNSSNMDWIKNEHTVNNTQFSFCSFIETSEYVKKRLTQVCPWTQCRENLTSFVRDSIMGGRVYEDKSDELSNLLRFIDKKTTRLLVLFKRENAERKIWRSVEDNVNRSLRIINFFEKRVSWPTSEVFKMRSEEIPPHCHIYMLRGPKQWMRSPHMLSLYALFLRIGKFECFDDFRTYRQFITMCNRLSTEALELQISEILTPRRPRRQENPKFYSWPDYGTSDMNHLHHTADKVGIILENQDKLFGERNSESLYRAADFNDGVTQLCRGQIKDKVVEENFVKLCKRINLSYGYKNLSSLATERVTRDRSL